MIWFTSDTHYGHANIIKYCVRPFADVDEMQRALVNRWNALVDRQDTVYHLGDFAFSNQADIEATRKQLVGRIVLVRGNHDRSTDTMRACGFDSVVDNLVLDGIYLRHKPLEYGEPEPAGVHAMFCGHVHEKWKTRTWHGRLPTVNVGVDQWDFRPVSRETLLATLP